MRQQATAHPDLALGGPSLTWLHAAFREMQALQALPAPATPALTALGTSERIISPRAVRRRMAAWPQGRLELFAKAEHEVMMELPAHRGRFLAETSAFFAAQS
jgi:lysophospholipase